MVPTGQPTRYSIRIGNAFLRSLKQIWTATRSVREHAAATGLDLVLTAVTLAGLYGSFKFEHWVCSQFPSDWAAVAVVISIKISIVLTGMSLVLKRLEPVLRATRALFKD